MTLESERIAMARKLGTEAGEAAASWYFDGNTTDETYARVLRGIDEGDPEILDTFPVPNLSGEWADEPTPQTILEAVGASEDDPEADNILRAWEDAASDGVNDSIERVARDHVEGLS